MQSDRRNVRLNIAYKTNFFLIYWMISVHTESAMDSTALIICSLIRCSLWLDTLHTNPRHGKGLIRYVWRDVIWSDRAFKVYSGSLGLSPWLLTSAEKCLHRPEFASSHIKYMDRGKGSYCSKSSVCAKVRQPRTVLMAAYTAGDGTGLHGHPLSI